MLVLNLALAAQPGILEGQKTDTGNGAQKITRRLVIKAKPKAEYTDEAKKNRTEGKVVLRVVFGADGQIGEIKPVHELPSGLTEMAIEAARRVKFEPEMRDGQPVSKTLNLVYIFRL
jgi:TonB family protein